MSVDEVAQIHEAAGWYCDALLGDGGRGASALPITGIWMFALGIPLIAFLAVLASAIRPYFERAGGAWRRLWLGLAIMLAGAIGVETLSNFMAEGSTLAVLETALEEMLEMVGSTVVLWSGLELLAAHGFDLQLSAATSPPSTSGPELRITRSARDPLSMAG